MSSGTVIWLDVFVFQILATFLFDWLLLWATAAISRTAASAARLVTGASLGTVYYVAYILSGQNLLPFSSVIRSSPVVLLISVAMLLVAFRSINPRRLFRISMYFYGIGFVSAGVGTVASFVFGTPGEPNSIVGFVAAGLAILLTAELGWGALQRRLWQQSLEIQLEVMFGGTTRTVTALVDTGNRLRDPLTREPVIVVEQSCLHDLLPPGLQPAVEHLASGDLGAIGHLLASERWSTRFRLIPFSSLGKDHGLLVGFRPDMVRLAVEGTYVEVGPCILGMCKGPLDPEGTYKALIHPELVQANAAEPQQRSGGLRAFAAERRPMSDVTRSS